MPFVEMGMSNLKFQFCPYWVFSVDQTFTQRSPVGKYVSLGLRDGWAGDTIPWDWMSSQRNECRYKRQEDPRAQSYSITTLRGQGEETESAKSDTQRAVVSEMRQRPVQTLATQSAVYRPTTPAPSGSLLKMQTRRPLPDLPNQNLHVNKIPR